MHRSWWRAEDMRTHVTIPLRAPRLQRFRILRERTEGDEKESELLVDLETRMKYFLEVGLSFSRSHKIRCSSICGNRSL
jgi:hypothetical protein